MAISYEDWKTQYEWMTTAQQKNYANMVKWNATAEEYANRYIQEKQNAGTFGQKTAQTFTPTSNNVSTPVQKQETQRVTDTPKQETPTTVTAQTEQTTAPEIKQQWALKPLSQEYYNQTSQESQDKIINNLNNYKTTNPEYFTDYESFKKNFSYDARNDEQKNTLDTWYKWYQKWLELSTQTTSDLYTQFKWWILSSSDLESLRISNPAKYAELQTAINRWSIISQYDEDVNQTTWENMWEALKNQWLQNMITNLNTSWSWASSIFADYQDKMESPEMVSLWDQATEKQEEIGKLTADIDSIKKTVEAEYEWTGASRSKINAIISDRTYDLQLQLRTLNSEYNKIATQYNNRMNQYQNEFQLQLQEYQINMQERTQKMNELWFAMDLMSYETPEQKQEREWNYWVKQQEYQNWDINSKDYSTRYKAALKSVENLLAQYPWIPMVRSAEQMAEDILKNIDAKGTTLGQELSEINSLIHQKPEYKKLYNNTYWTTEWIGKTYTIWWKEYVEYNWELMLSSEFNKKFWSKGNPKPYNQVDEKQFETTSSAYKSMPYATLGSFLEQKNKQVWDKWWECGKFVNDYLQYIWVTDGSNRYYDNDLSTKLNSVNSSIPKVWTIAVFDFDHKSSDWINHWHVSIVTKVHDDWSFDVIESNYDTNKPWIITTRNVKSWSWSLKWFFDPSQPISSSQSSTQWEWNFVSWSIEWIPLTFERAVKNLVPAALQNSDAEREALNTIITNAYAWGVPQSEIALSFMWFDIKNESDKNLALDLVNTVRTLNTDTQEWIVQTISDMINSGNYVKAIQTVENAVSQQAKSSDNYVPEAGVKNTINKTSNLKDYIWWLDEDPRWAISWTMQEWMWSLKSNESKELLQRITALARSLDINDKDTQERLLPQLTDNPIVFMNKLDELDSNLMNELNWWRNMYWLPSLDTDSLNNYWNRVTLYRNNAWWVSVISNTTSSSSSWLWFEESVANLKEKYWVK